MKKLIDIKCYWNKTFDFNMNDKDTWEGQILLEEDGWFEGIVNDPYSQYKGYRFIFGIYHPEKVIELYKYAPEEISKPLKFHGDRDAKGYDGEFSIIGLFGEQPYGNCHIITQYSELARNNIQEEVSSLEAKIKYWKDYIMYCDCKLFYDNTIAMRRVLSEIILKNHNGETFTDEEIGKIKEEFYPIQNKIIRSTVKEIKQLAKRMPFDFNCDEELPF